MAQYKQVSDGERVDCGHNRTHRIRCCDCGLVHVYRFEITKTGRMRFRAWRDNRATANTRRGWKMYRIEK